MRTAAGDLLETIIAEKRRELRDLLPRAGELRRAALRSGGGRSLGEALRRTGEVRLLAEVKRRSPSAGEIRPDADVRRVALDYAEAGAAALSVLTDHRFFGGSLRDLEEVRAAVDVPLLRKDFVIAREQVWEARAHGADAVLLIVRVLDDELLRALHAEAIGCGLEALVEVHDGGELERALRLGATLIGVNNRDLASFTTRLERSLELAASVPEHVTLVSESGIRTAEDVARLGAAGFDAVLVGESLMRERDVGAAAAALTGQRKRVRG